MYTSVQKRMFLEHEKILVYGAPESFSQYEAYLTAPIDREIHHQYPCIIFFTASMDACKKDFPTVLKALKYSGLFWFCYPKKGSAAYSADLSKQKIALYLEAFNYEIVEQKPIDQNWTALRIQSDELI